MERSFALGLIIAFPLVASAGVLLAGRFLRRWLGDDRGKVVSVYLALFGSSMALFFLGQAVLGVLTDPRVSSLVDEFPPWLMGDEIAVQAKLVLDPLSGAFALALALVATFVQVFCVGWAGEREDGHLVFAWLGAMQSAALLLLFAGSMMLLIWAWTAIAVLSHLAVGWRSDAAASAAARRHLGFEVVGTLALLAGLLVLTRDAPSVDFETIRLAAAPGAGSTYRSPGLFGLPVAEVAVGLFGVALAVRAGLLPLHAAVEASAHAPLPQLGVLQGGVGLLCATYVVIRLEALVAIAPVAMALMVVLGLLSAVVGALVALGEDRIDRVLTYSSISQAGLTFAALGVGAWSVGMAMALAHAVAKVGLALACAAAAEGDGTLARTRVRAPTVVFASFVLSASLGGLIPGVGFFAMYDTTLHVLVGASAWSVGINYAGFCACLLAAVATTAYAFRLHYAVFPRPRPTPARPEDGAYGFVTAGLAALALGLGVLWAPELVQQPRVLEQWIEPQMAVSLGFAGGNEMFAIGPSVAWSGADGLSAVVQWCVLVAVVTATFGTWRRGRAAWVSGATRPVGALAQGVRLACWMAALELAGWRRLARLADAVSTIAQFGIDDIVSERGSAIVGRLGGETGAALLRLGIGSGRRAVVGVLLGVGLVLGWIYFKPSIASIGPTVVHDFGGLRPGLERPAQDRLPSRSATTDRAATALDAEAPDAADSTARPAAGQEDGE